MTAVETLRSRAKFAEGRGSHDFAAHLRRVADMGEKAAQFEIDETRAVGKAIVIRADLKAALDEFLDDFAKDPGISWDEAIEVMEAKITEMRAELRRNA